MKTQSPDVVSASRLTGEKVYNPEGEHLGEVKDVVIDLDSGGVAYAVLSFGGFLGFGDKYFAIPWGAIDLNAERDHVVLSVSKEALEQAPGFEKDDWPLEPDRDFLERLHRRYGYEPHYERTSAP